MEFFELKINNDKKHLTLRLMKPLETGFSSDPLQHLGKGSMKRGMNSQGVGWEPRFLLHCAILQSRIVEKKEKLKCLKREHEELEVKHARLKQKYEGCFLGQKYTSKYFLNTFHGGKKHIDPPSFILLLFGEQKHLVIFSPSL